MSYARFDGNESDVMETFLRHNIVPNDIKRDYPYQINALLRKKMIKKHQKRYIITERGKSAITQQIRTGEYWVAPLKPKKFNPYGTAKISKELVGYVH